MRIIGALFILILCISCDTRQPIVDLPTTWVKIYVDWEPSKIVPYGATYCIYGITDTEKTIMFHSHTAVDSVYLAEGEYACLVFNETASSHEGITFTGLKQYHTACAKMDVKERNDSLFVTDLPDLLVVGSVSRFEVTQADVRKQHVVPVHVTPRRVTVPVHCELPVTGLKNVSRHGGHTLMPYFASSILLATQETVDDPVYLRMPIDQRTFSDDAPDDGSLSGHANSFGLVPNFWDTKESFTIQVDIKLRNGEMMPPQAFEVMQSMHTSSIELSDDDIVSWEDQSRMSYPMLTRTSRTPAHNVYQQLWLYIEPTEVVIDAPDVTNNETPGSGMQATVDDWGEPIVIPVDF